MKTADTSHHAEHHSRGNGHAGDGGLSHDIGEIRDGIAHVRDDVRELAQSAVHAGQSGAAAVQELAGKAVDRVSEVITDGVAGLKKSSGRTVKTFKQQVAEYPVASTLVALGAGFILAKFLRRK